MPTLAELRAKLSVEEYIKELHIRHENDQAWIATHLLRIKELEEHLEFAEHWMGRDVLALYQQAWQAQELAKTPTP